MSAFAVVDDVRRCVTSDLKEAGNRVYVVGVTRDEMGGSHLGLVRGVEGGVVPEVRTDESKTVLNAVHRAISGGTVRACHDCSEGGLAVALAEMAFAGGLGIDAQLVQAPFEETATGGVRDDVLLFAESPARLVCEVRESDAERFEEALGDAPFAQVGTVTEATRLRVSGLRGRIVVDECIEDLRQAFTGPLREGAVQ